MKLDEVHLELASFCNLACPYCTWQTGDVARQTMPTELALRLVRECAALGVRTMNFHGVGEPTLHPELLEILRAAERLGLDYCLSTNVVRLAGPLAAGLHELAGLTLYLSLHWSMPEPQLAAAVANAGDYLRARPANRRAIGLLVCAEANQAHYWRHLAAFMPHVERWDNVWLYLKAPLTWPDSPPVPGFACSDLAGHPRVLIERVALPRSIGRHCDMPTRFLKVAADGTLAPCCVETRKRWGLGSIEGRTLAEVWASPAMAEVRAAWRRASDALPCGRCLKRTDC